MGKFKKSQTLVCRGSYWLLVTYYRSRDYKQFLRLKRKQAMITKKYNNPNLSPHAPFFHQATTMADH